MSLLQPLTDELLRACQAWTEFSAHFNHCERTPEEPDCDECVSLAAEADELSRDAIRKATEPREDAS